MQTVLALRLDDLGFDFVLVLWAQAVASIAHQLASGTQLHFVRDALRAHALHAQVTLISTVEQLEHAHAERAMAS